MKNIYWFFVLLFLVQCQPNKEQKTMDEVKSYPRFAKNFDIENYGDYKLLIVKDAYEGATEVFEYVLYRNEKPSGHPNATFIKLPIQKVVCMSTTHAAFLNALNEDEAIVAVAGNLYDEKLQARLQNGDIKNLGDGTSLNYELLLDLEPDVVFTFGVSDAASLNKIKSLGLKPVIISEFRDETPIARAEWIKFFATFFEKEEKAELQFQHIHTNYQNIKNLALTATKSPSVFTGVPFQGTWYVPSGESFVAQFIHDANGDYLWKDKKGSMSLALDFEAVFAKAADADKWLDIGYVFSRTEVSKMDKRFEQFAAFQAGEMYNYTARVSENGGFDYYESAVVHPDLVLRDVVKALHPSLIEEDFYYYEKF